MTYPKYSLLSDIFSKYPVSGVNSKRWDVDNVGMS